MQEMRSTRNMTAMDNKDRILELLGHGLSSTIVASTVGCDPSYISQLMETEGFKDKVLELRAKGAEASIKRDGRWDSLEELALQKIEQVMPLVTRPSDLIRIAQIANNAKRAAKELANGADSSAPTVNLILPQSAVVHFQMNANAQVVEIDGRSMAPLPTKHLQQHIADRAQAKLAAPDGAITTVEVRLPGQPSAAALVERKKVISTLEAIGYAEEAEPVANILAS